jgi:hypothetical protein
MDGQFKLFVPYSCGHRGYLWASSNEEAVRLADLALKNLCPHCELLSLKK